MITTELRERNSISPGRPEMVPSTRSPAFFCEADFLIGFSLKDKRQPEPGLDGARGHHAGGVL